MTKEEAKRFAEVLLAYSRGEPVQVQTPEGAWVTVEKDSLTLHFDDRSTAYRLPPPKISYRNWLYKDAAGHKVCVVVDSTPKVVNDASLAFHTPGFVRWLGDWQEAEL